MNKAVALFVAPETNSLNNNINVIRFSAAAMVIYGHMAHLAGYAVPQLFGEDISTVAVKIFFILSGYLITQSYQRDGNVFRYLIRRVFRIFPGLVFLCFTTAFVIGPFLSSLSVHDYFSNLGTYYYFIKNSLMNPVYGLPGVFAENYYPVAVNGSLWTLPVEFSMYILLPICIVAFKKMRCLKPGLVSVSLLLLVFEIIHIVWYPDWRFVIWGTNVFDGLALAPYFFAGAVFTFPEVKGLLNLQWGVVLAFVLEILILSNSWEYELALFICLPYIVLSFSFAAPAIFGRVFAQNDYSYGLYLWAFFVQQILVSIIGLGTMSILPYALISFAVSLLCAMISWHLVEKPCNKLGKRITAWSRNKEKERLSTAS